MHCFNGEISVKRLYFLIIITLISKININIILCDVISLSRIDVDINNQHNINLTSWIFNTYGVKFTLILFNIYFRFYMKKKG